MLAACGTRSEDDVAKASPAPEPAEPLAPAPAMTPAETIQPPERAQAAETLMSFAQKLLADDIEGARVHLRIPTGYTDKQVDYYLRELRAPEHLSVEGLSQIVQDEFGPLAERFGEQAGPVAEKLGVPLEAAYAFGDTSAAALLTWDGKVFRVAALHRLSKP